MLVVGGERGEGVKAERGFEKGGKLGIQGMCFQK